MPPNKPLELPPLRVEQDRVDLESWIWLNRFPVYRGGAGERQAIMHMERSRPLA